MVGGGHLFFQGSHPLLQMELQPLVGLGQQLVHRVREALVVFVIHPLPLPRLRGRVSEMSERERFLKISAEAERREGGGGELITGNLLDRGRERERETTTSI